MKLKRICLLVWIAAAFLGGCVFETVKKDMKELAKTFKAAGKQSLKSIKQDISEFRRPAYLKGAITLTSPAKGPFVVVVYSDATREIADFTILNSPQPFLFILPPGEYILFAFADTNNNRIYDKDERSSFYGSPDRIIAKPAQVIKDLDIGFSETSHAYPDFQIDLNALVDKPGKYAGGHGTIVSIDDNMFSKKYAAMGLWIPSVFLRKIGGGVLFLEAYDPDKIPILFVHGSGGSPKDWDYFVKRIDRRRFQPWCFYYPSGLPLEKIGTWLNNEIKDLHARYRFNRLYVTGHSIGGLVSRSFIIKNVFEDHQDYVKKFFSIATPWAGIERAKFGAERAPVSVSSWKDIAPGSGFLESNFETAITPKVSFYLFYGKKGRELPFSSNGDGAVSIQSALYSRAQMEATKIYGFNEDHAGILLSEDVLKIYNDLLIADD